MGKLALLKDKAEDGVDKMRRKLGRNKDLQCRLHLKVPIECCSTERLTTQQQCWHRVLLSAVAGSGIWSKQSVRSLLIRELWHTRAMHTFWPNPHTPLIWGPGLVQFWHCT